MEPLKVLEKLYEEGRKKIPSLCRRILWGEIDGKVEFYERLNGAKQICYENGRGGLPEKRDLEKSLDYLKSKGFSSAEPTLKEFLERNGFESEFATFFELYSSALLRAGRYQGRAGAGQNEAIKEAREQGIRDAESSARARNRNRSYKESWEGDE